MTDTDRAVLTLRKYAEHLADIYHVAWPVVLAHIAEHYDIAAVAQDNGLRNQFINAVAAFCQRAHYDSRPPDERAEMERQSAQRIAYAKYSFRERSALVLKGSGVPKTDWAGVMMRALDIPAADAFHLCRLSPDEAIDALRDAAVASKEFVMAETTKTKPAKKKWSEAEYEERRARLLLHVQDTWKELEVRDVDQQRQIILNALKGPIPAIASADCDIEAAIKQFDEYVEKNVRGPRKELNKALGRVAEEQQDLFNQDMAKPVPELPRAQNNGNGATPETKVEAPPAQTAPAPQSETPTDMPALASETPVEPPKTVPTQGEYLGMVDSKPLRIIWSNTGENTFMVKIVVADLVDFGEARKSAAEFKVLDDLKRLGYDCFENENVEPTTIWEWEEDSPSVERINALRDAALSLAKARYPDDTEAARVNRVKDIWGGKIVKEALCAYGHQRALELLHEKFAQADPEPEPAKEPDATPQYAVATLPQQQVQPTALAPQPSNIIPFQQATTFKLPTPMDLQFIDWYAEVSVASGMYPSVTNAAQAKMVMIRGHFMGVDPAAAMDSIYPIRNAKTGAYAFTVAAPLAKAMVERTKECDKFDVSGDGQKATVVVRRRGREEHVYTFTIDDAKRRNLTGKWNWSAAPEVMLKYRAMTQAIKIEFPEIYYFFPEVDDEAA